MNLVFWLGITSPLVLVCLIFVVVGIAGNKQDNLAPPPSGAAIGPERVEPVDPSPRLS